MTNHHTMEKPGNGFFFRAHVRHAALVSVVVGSLALAAGCASFYSAKAGSGSKDGVGIPYSLPEGMIAMTVKFTGEASKSGEVTKTSENSTTKKTVSKGKEETAETTEDTTSTKGTDTTQTTGSPAPTVISVDTQVSFIPDASQTYLINPGSNLLHESDLTIHVSNGLLTSINSADRSKVEDIVTSIAKTAAYVVELTDKAPGETPTKETKKSFQQEGQPPSRPTRSDVEALLNELAGTSHSFTYYQMETNEPVTIAQCIDVSCTLERVGRSAAKYKGDGGTSPGGVFVRTLVPYTCRMTLIVDGKKYGKLMGLADGSFTPANPTIYKSRTIVLLPDPESLVLVPASRSPFGDTKNKFELDRGVLTGSEASRPSEVYALVKIPLAAVKAVIESVSELLTLRVTVNNNRTALAESQAALKEKQADVEKRLEKLEATSGK